MQYNLLKEWKCEGEWSMEKERDWYWCSECDKAYQETDDGECPYCGAKTSVDGWWWPKLRRTNPQLPEVPIEGNEYDPEI